MESRYAVFTNDDKFHNISKESFIEGCREIRKKIPLFNMRYSGNHLWTIRDGNKVIATVVRTANNFIEKVNEFFYPEIPAAL